MSVLLDVFAAIVEDLAPVLNVETHKHRCGYGWGDDDGFSPKQGQFRYSGQGCGIVFEHERGGSHDCTHCGVNTVWKYYGPIKPGNGLRRDLRPNRLHGPPAPKLLRARDER